MNGAGTTMATRSQSMPYTTGHSRYFSIEYSDMTYVPRVFLDVENTVNAPQYTTVYLKQNRDSAAYVDRNLIESGMFPSELWEEDQTLNDMLDDLMARTDTTHRYNTVAPKKRALMMPTVGRRRQDARS